MKRVKVRDIYCNHCGLKVDIYPRVKLADLKPGDAFNYGGKRWIKLQGGDASLCITENLIKNKAFDENDCNDWRTSTLRKWLNNDFLQELYSHESDIETEPPKPFMLITSDLTADDGMTDYGTADDYIALLTCDLYRKHRDIIPPVDNWYWTLTPWTCKKEYSCLVRSVFTSGALTVFNAYGGHWGLRPLCNLKSEIMVSTN